MGVLVNTHSTYRDAVVIYNPFAGRLARREHLLQRTIEHLKSQGIHARLVPTTGPHSATALTRCAVERGADLVLAAGGDGTINEVANGLIHTDVPLGILPGGTANVLAHELKMQDSPTQVAKTVSKMVPCRVSVGLLRGEAERRHFLLMAGVGLDAQIIYNLNLDLKAALGKLAYYIGGFGHVFQSIPQFDVEISGQHRRCGFALVSRVRNYGGDLEIARGASLLRTDFEVVLFEGESAVEYLKYLAAVVLNRAEGLKGVTIMRSKCLTCSSPEDSRIRAQVDGELGCQLPVTIEIVPEALTLLVPPAYLEREQALQQVAICA